MPLSQTNPVDPLELGFRPGHLIWRAQQRAWRVFREECTDPSVTPVQASILLVIAFQPGIDQQTLARTVALDKATTGNVVKRLVEQGFIERNINSTDKRAKSLQLTPAGRRLNKKLGEVTRRARTRLVETLDKKEQEMLVRLLRKVAGIREDD